MLNLHIIIKYIILIGLIYLILRNIPSIEIYKKDIILIIMILVIILFIFDYVISQINSQNISQANKHNNIICENMETTTPTIPSSTPKPSLKPKIGDPSPAGDMNTHMNSNYNDYHNSIVKENDEILRSYNTILQNNLNNLLSQSTNKPTDPNLINLLSILSTKPIANSNANNNTIINPNSNPNINPNSNPNISTNCEIAINNLTNQFNSKITDLQMKLNLVNNQANSNSNISLKYYNDLVTQLLNKGILTNDDITNIKIKVENKLLTINDVIIGLEKLNTSAISKNTSEISKNTNYNMPVDTPIDFYTPIGDKVANNWSDNYTILDSSKWMVPMPRPPVCINNTPCKVCPIDDTSYPVSLQTWDNSRNITQNNTN